MDNFDAHKWFKKEYLGEGHTEDKMRDDMEARKRSRLSPNELKKLDAIRAFYRGETDVLPADLKEDDLDEIRYPQDDFTQSQLVPRMEMAVEEQGEKETYKRFVDSLDDLLDVWYMKGFEKDDVLAFMKVIIPSS